MIPNGIGAAGGWLLDRALGEPPVRWHPVAWFGTAMRRLEQHTYRDSRTAGAVHVALGTGAAVATGFALQQLIGRSAATLAASTVAIAGRMLAAEADAVLDRVRAGDIPGARTRLAGLVGRDTTELDTTEIVRAVIESVAENTVDAVTAPIFWAAVGGAPAVLAHRAINTLDAMIGHHNTRYERFGWVAARTDDVANWVPARLTALAVAAVRPRHAHDIARTVRRDAHQHPSPNGGVVEAAFAAALDTELGGINRYAGSIEDRGHLGDGPAPTVKQGTDAIRLAGEAATLAMFLISGLSLLREVRNE